MSRFLKKKNGSQWAKDQENIKDVVRSRIPSAPGT